MIKKKVKKEQWPKRKMGNHCGYSLNKDGSIVVAPKYRDLFIEISDDQQALSDFMFTVTTHCASLQRPISKRRQDLWQKIADDYGFNLGDGWSMDIHKGLVTKQSKSE